MALWKMKGLISWGIVGCFLLVSTPAMAAEEDIMKQLAEGNNAFAVDLYHSLRQEAGNLFFSPYSISTALAMTYAGARSTTEQEMATTLHFTMQQETLHAAFAELTDHFEQIQQKGDIRLNTANALWLQEDYEILETFLGTLEKHYQANLFRVNFKGASEDVRNQINQWVEKQTNKKIKNLIPPGVLNELTRLVLTNAIYFKGNWALQFDKALTTDESFWPAPNQEITVPMMYQRAAVKYGEKDDIQVVLLPYAGEDLVMAILLPKEKDGLGQLEKRLTVDYLTALISEASMREVDVYLPRFTFTRQFALSAPLSALGMAEAFSDGADFSGIEPSKQLSITDVLHKAFVEVNEEGTEAAAATAVVVGVTSVMDPKPIPVFRADHPFLFCILDNYSENLLFLGRLANP